MVLILYGFVVFLATLLGSFVGLGGGVIIKPVLDVINAHSLTEISFFSSCAVFAMSITSTTRHIIKKTPIKPSIVLLVALGSVGGGPPGMGIEKSRILFFNAQKRGRIGKRFSI